MTPAKPPPSDGSGRRPRPQLGLGAALLGPEEETLVLAALRSGNLFRYYGADPAHPPGMVAGLEREFREYVGIDYALAVSSGTSALETALAALGIGPGDEVILPAWSWISCFTAVVRVGGRPVLAEIDPSFNLDPAEIGRLCTPRTRAVMAVHYQGAAGDLAAIQRESRSRHLRVIEDCAQALGTRYRGRSVGTWSDIATFSFQYNKVATAGEGGMVVTADPRLYERAARFQDLGLYRAHHAGIVPPREPAFAGGQCRMGELAGAVALAQLRKVEGLRAHCRRLQARILSGLAGLAGLAPRPCADPEGDFGFELCLLFDDAEKVKPFQARLESRNINTGSRSGTTGLYGRDYVKTGLAHAPGASPFRDFPVWPAPGYRAEDFPRTERIARRALALPLGARATEEDADYIAAEIQAAHRDLM